MTTDTQKQFRPPIVVILGHVDHGKTSILDYIRKSKVAEKESGPPRLAHFHSVVESEAGGITQHIGAYQVLHNDKLITFIDTPGHEAFSAMRSRGAKVADLAILVVAADESVKPQTKEAISHIKKAGLPMVVVFNKIDRPGANPEKVKSDLAKEEIYVESFGGKVPSVEISAKTGQGINELLEMILLVAEVEELGKMDEPDKIFGVIIESKLDAQRGPSATFLVKNGILKKRDAVAAESTYGVVKLMENWQIKSIEQAEASMPVLVIGLENVPHVGEKWAVCENMEQAKQKAKNKAKIEKEKREKIEFIETGEDKKIFNLILKSDVAGSLEAIRQSLNAIPQDKIILRVLRAEVGDINESDIKLAESAKAQIFGFRIKNALSAIAEQQKVKVATSDVIYDLIQAVREEASLVLEPETIRRNLGRAKVIAYFKDMGKTQVFGARVLDGILEKGALLDVMRDSRKIGSGRAMRLEQNKVEIKEGLPNDECGILFEGQGKVEIGDILEIYEEEKKKIEL